MDSKSRDFHGLRSEDLLEGEPTFQFTSVDEMDRTIKDFQDRYQKIDVRMNMSSSKMSRATHYSNSTVTLQDCPIADIYTSTTRKLFELQ
jgi:hypothetical protein